MNEQIHNSSNYLGIVKHFISVGHIHTFSTCDRIVAEGSLDRMSHNEEEAKGGVLFNLRMDGNHSFTFIENKNAKIFKTVNLKSKDLDRSMAQIKREISKLPNNSYVRIKAAKDHSVYAGFDQLKLLYPMFYFSKKNNEDETNNIASNNAELDLAKSYNSISITPDNIKELITQQVISKYSLTDRQQRILDAILE